MEDDISVFVDETSGGDGIPRGSVVLEFGSTIGLSNV